MPQWLISLFHFRNSGHAAWFFFSMAILAACLLGMFFIRKEKPYFLWYPAAMHLLTSVSAVLVLLVLKRESEAFSLDCVWFNGLMFCVYAAIFLFKKRKKIGGQKLRNRAKIRFGRTG